MAWSKTDAGRQEIQSRSKLTTRAQRTLLLLIDGRRSDAELLAAVHGTTAADFDALAALGLIAAAAAAGGMPPGETATAPAPAPPPTTPTPTPTATTTVPTTRGAAPSAASFLRAATEAAPASAAAAPAPAPAAAPVPPPSAPAPPASLPPASDGHAAGAGTSRTDGRAWPAPDSHVFFTETLNELISNHLGLRGFALTLAVEKAATLEELRAVAERVIAAIVERQGAAQGDAARQALYGSPQP